MSEVELVIKMSEKEYKKIIEDGECDYLRVINAIENGELLPEGRGDLIDVNDIRVIKLDDGLHEIEYKKGNGVDVYIEAPTVIKADANADANKNSNATANKKIVWEPVERKEAQ